MIKKLPLILLLLISNYITAGTLVTNLTTLSSFGNVYAFNSSSSLFYTVSGTTLTSPLIITAPNAFEISINYAYGYSSSLSINPASGNINNTVIFVRFSPTNVGTYTAANNNIVNSSAGSNSINVSVSGTCVTFPTSTSNYYSTVNTQYGAALKTVLFNKVSTGTTSVSYTPGVWNAYQTTDVQPSGKVWDIYSTRLDQASPYEYTMSTNQCGTYSVEGNCYNREHSFPQSWFNQSSPMVTELFHIYASDGKVNGMRSNYPYGYVSTPSYTSLYGGKLGTGPNNFGYTGTVFEPIDEYKGDLARGYFFMATRYENLIGTWVGTNFGTSTDVLAGNSFPVYLPWQLGILLSWHNQDPVSDKEIKRNNAIAAIQGNRNPYIDSPQFVQRIWGGNISPEPTINASNFSYTHNGSNTATLNWTSGNGTRRLVIAKAGSMVNSFPVDTINYNANATFGVGTNIGNNCFVVYNGTGSSCTITGLNNTTNYYFSIIEYNGTSSISNYNTNTYFSSGIVALPVKWLGFDANLQHNKKTLLTWQTASEQNNAWFEIEKSTDNYNWNTISKLRGFGNSNSIKSYQYIDEVQNNSNIIYYRIKQIDINGSFSYSVTRIIKIENNLSIQVSPNPFNSDFKISVESDLNEKITIQITTLQGKVIVSKQISINAGFNELEINDLLNFDANMYILSIESNLNKNTYKIIKQQTF